MVGLIEELQEKAKIMRRHEAHRRFRLLRLSNAEEKKCRHQDNAPTTTAIDHRHTRALNNGRKMTICLLNSEVAIALFC